MQTDEPEVLTWMAIMASRCERPRISAPGHHWWREYVTETWRLAYETWAAQREEFAVQRANRSEWAEFSTLYPPPKLSDCMVSLSGRGWHAEQESA